MNQSIIQFILFINKLLSFSLWPRKFYRLQILAAVSLSTIVISCAVDFVVPIYTAKVVDSLTPSNKNEPAIFRWDLVTIFVVLKVLQGIGALGLLTCIQQFMWLSIEQHLRRHIQAHFFHHVHTMSLSWMIDAKLGEILGALDRGTQSILSTLEHLLYCVFPTIAKIIIAVIFLSYKFGWVYGLIIGTQIILYTVFTAFIIEKRSMYQTNVNDGEDCLRQKVMESLVHLEMVKCFANEKFERDRYLNELIRTQHHKYRIEALTGFAGTVQQVIISVGMLACSLLLLSSSFAGKKVPVTPGNYVLLTSYLAQLYGPLNYLAGYYKVLRVNIINAQTMMECYSQEPAIKNSPLAYDLDLKRGEIEFQNVCLASDSGENILHDISFKVYPRTTVALVGTTGSGKTSLARLLLRLHDPVYGQVLIDEQNVKDVTIKSLRRSICIVPQDATLFNDTIRYGKPNATDHEVCYAAMFAQIHETIRSFPNGYDTIVGERGTRLSGGERQRIAICRAILQNPKVIILDEVTSNLDAKTEQHIQEVLKNLCKTRTCVMITHKLACTVNVDCIIVLKNGRIVEKGSHSSLIEKNGHFANMWNSQMKGANSS